MAATSAGASLFLILSTSFVIITRTSYVSSLGDTGTDSSNAKKVYIADPTLSQHVSAHSDLILLA